MKQPGYFRRRPAAGFTLVELMVSMAIGLVVTIAVVSSYLGSANATRMAEAQTRMNEDGQAALSILAQQLRMAGNNPKRSLYAAATPRNPVYATDPPFFIRGCDGTFSNVTSAADIAALTCAGGGGPDSIAVSYEADPYNTVPTTLGAATDCLGQGLTAQGGNANVWNGASSVSTAVTFTVADNRFYLKTPTGTTTPSLYCKGNSGGEQPLVENVEDLQFQYGATTLTGTSAVAGYITTATAVAALGKPTDEERWAKVITVRVCVLIRSENPVVQDSDSARYVGCDGLTSDAQSDLRLRRTYSTTVVLRNRASLP